MQQLSLKSVYAMTICLKKSNDIFTTFMIIFFFFLLIGQKQYKKNKEKIE